MKNLPINTGPGSSGVFTSLDSTRFPLGKTTSIPFFSCPNRGPGFTPSSTHFAKSRVPRRFCIKISNYLYNMQTINLNLVMQNERDQNGLTIFTEQNGFLTRLLQAHAHFLKGQCININTVIMTGLWII